jgi:hypothetical protein
MRQPAHQPRRFFEAVLASDEVLEAVQHTAPSRAVV